MTSNIVIEAAAMLQEAGVNPGEDGYEALLAATVQALGRRQAASAQREAIIEHGKRVHDAFLAIAAEMKLKRQSG